MKCRLSADVVDKRLATDFVIRLQNVMNLLHDVLVVAHGASGLSGLSDLDHHAEPSSTGVCVLVLLDVLLSISLASVFTLVGLL